MQEQTLSSIEKSVLILEQLGTPPYQFKAAELARLLGFNRSSTYRILQVLKRYDMVALQPGTDAYKIGPAMYHIGTSYLNNQDYLSSLRDVLVEISEETKESVGMAVPDGDKIISVYEVEVHQPMKLNDLPGRYFPPNKGCYGKIITAYQSPGHIEKVLAQGPFEKTLPNTLTTREELLAEYETIRRQGYATSIDEQGIDILAVGIPIFYRNGRIAACVAVAFLRSDGWEARLDSIRERLLSYKEKLEHFLP